MSGEVDDYCYGLDVSSIHDYGVTVFKFLDTDKSIILTELELSILANYILDQYTSKDSTNSLMTIKDISSKIESLEICLSNQISKINNPDKVDIEKLLCDLDKIVTDDDRFRLDKEIPFARQSIMDR